jgi:hypothetical protein
MAQTIHNTKRIPNISDETVIALFDALVRKFPPSDMRIDAPSTSFGTFTNRDAFSPALKSRDWTASRGVSLAVAKLLNGLIHVNFHRYITEGQHQRASMWETEIYIDRTGDAKPEQMIDVFQFVEDFGRTHFAAVPTDVEPQSETRDILAAQISRLAELQTSIVQEAERARIAGEQRLTARRTELEAEIDRLKQSAETAVTAAREQLAEEEASLARRKQELDDRDHMHVRRGLRADITEDMQQRLASPPVSRSTSGLRTQITLYSVVGIAVLLLVAGLGLWDARGLSARAADMDAWALGYVALRVVGPLAVATGLLIYLLNWLRRVHAEDVRSERDLARYRYDINRASWAAETILEAQSDTGTRIPSDWIKGATQGLFSRSESGGDDRSAHDALAALLGFSAKARVGTDGLHVEMGKQDLRRISREAE